MFTANDYKRVREYFNYPYKYKDQLKNFMDNLASQYDPDFVTDVRGILDDLDSLELEIDSALEKPSASRIRVEGQYEVEYKERSSGGGSNLHARKLKLLGKLQDYLGLSRYHNQPKIIRS